MNEIEKWRKVAKISGREHAKVYRAYEKLYVPITPGGFVYIIQLGDTNVYKIGITNDLSRRLSQLQSKCPIPLTIVHRWWGHDFQAFEKALHLKFSSQRIRGEWFKLSTSDLLDLVETYPVIYDERIQDNAN